MNVHLVLEILDALAALATIGGFVREIAKEYKTRSDDEGRKKE